MDYDKDLVVIFAAALRGEASLSTWVYRIAVNVCLNWGREKKSRFARELGMVGPHLCQLRGGVSVWCEFTWYRIRVSLLLSD